MGRSTSLIGRILRLISIGMDENEQLIAIAEVLSSPTRMRLLGLVGPKGRCVGEAAALAGVSQATASYHLGRLLEVGLVLVVPRGRRRVYRWGRERWALARIARVRGHSCSTVTEK
jgi:DNA-binding transcriptional ArsR family regulator